MRTLILALALAVGASSAFAADVGEHPLGDDPYEGWTNKNGGACCHNVHCAESFVNGQNPDGSWWVQIHGTVYQVLPYQHVKQDGGDGLAHVCFTQDESGTYLACFKAPPSF